MSAMSKYQNYGGGIGCSFPDESAPKPSAKSCRKVARHDFRRGRCIDEEALQIAKEVFELAFSGPSENAICDKAQKVLGISENTARAILRKRTQHPSFNLVLAAAGYAVATGKDITTIRGLSILYKGAT